MPLSLSQVVWEGLDSPPWKSYSEPELRAFLLDRAREGFSFPLNPVWAVRDVGWYEVLQALQQHKEASENFRSWLPPASNLLQRIDELHEAYPAGFTVAVAPPARRQSFFANMADCDGFDLANYASLEVRRETKARWQRIRSAMKVHTSISL